MNTVGCTREFGGVIRHQDTLAATLDAIATALSVLHAARRTIDRAIEKGGMKKVLVALGTLHS